MDADAYRGAWVFSVTVNTLHRTYVFVDSTEVNMCETLLVASAQRHGFALLAYCFMPDHLHVLVEGSAESDLTLFMKDFKQGTSFDYKQRCGKQLWQRSYYDHVIRNDEDEEAAFAYILENPVQAGLVENFDAYPYTGGDWVRDMLVAT